MTATERVKQMLENKRVDSIGASGWYHTPECDRASAAEFAARIIEITDHSNWDFIKIMPNGIYMQEAYGSNIEYLSKDIPLDRLKSKMIFNFHGYLVNSPEDMYRFPVLDVKQNPVFQREVALVRALADHYKGTVPVIPTVFLPCHTIPEFVGGIPKARWYFENHPEAVDHMLKSLYETERQLLQAYLDAGADGFFFATRYSNSDILSRAEFERFCLPYEPKLVQSTSDRAWFNMMHIHGVKNFYWDYYETYNVQAYNWENVPSSVPEEERTSVAKLRAMTDRILITGTDQFHDFYGSVDEVHARFQRRLARAAAESGDHRLIFAPGCSLPLDIDPEAVHQIRVVVDEYNAVHTG